MADKRVDFPQIISTEIQLKKVVGRGTFGVVKEGIWKKERVAIKIYETEEKQKKDFEIESRQLSRVSHQNIVRLYGFVSEPKFVALVMEYAEGGMLHSDFEVPYRLWHVINWLLQCARGISYMHAMRPKPLIHRDLKSLNLLLLNRGIHLKICDFGTVCDLRSIMTTSKGSIAWMAPEVFRTNNYSEKCDVFSWAIVLWELLSRKIPWQQYIGSPYTIMWVVGSNGERPPLISCCPKLIENVLTKCWSEDPNERPSMIELELTLEQIIQSCPKPQYEPILYNFQNDEDSLRNNYHRLDIHMETHFSDLQQKIIKTTDREKSFDDNYLFQNRRIATIARSYSNESLDSKSNRSAKNLKRFHSDGNAIKHDKYINATEPLPQDFKIFEKYQTQELEISSRMQYLSVSDCQQLIPISESYKTLYEQYLRLKSERMVLLSRKQELEKYHKNADKQVICLEDQNDCLNQLRKCLKTRLRHMKQEHQQREDIDNGWEVVNSELERWTHILN